MTGQFTGGVCNVSAIGATAGNIATLGANVIYCSNFPNLVIPPQQSLSDISGNSVTYSTGTFAKQLTANASNVQTFGATAANIVSLGANTIYCSNFPNLIIPPQQSLQDISGNSLTYNAATISKQLTANVCNIQNLGATAANIPTLQSNTIYCSNFPNLVIPPQQSLQDISGNSVSYSTGTFAKQLTANVTNVQTFGAAAGNIATLGANVIYCSNFPNLIIPPQQSLQDIAGNSATYGLFRGNLSSNQANVVLLNANVTALSNVVSMGMSNVITYLKADPGDMVVRRYGGVGDNYGMGQYTGGAVRMFTSALYAPATVNMSLAATDGASGSGTQWTDIVTASQSSVVMNRPVYATSLNLSGTNTLSLGYDVAGKEPNAGKIGYGSFSNYNSLDLVGAGTSNGQRRVQVYDSLIINGGGPGGGNLYAVNGQFTGNVSTTGAVAASTVVCGNVAGDMITKTFASAADRYGIGAYSPGVMRVFSSGTIPSTVNLSVATDGSQGFQDILAAGQSSVVVNRPLYLPNGNISISGTNPICLGYDVAGKDNNAGKIGYGTFSSGAGLDIVGAGTGTNRLVKIYDNLNVPSASVGSLTVTGTGQFTGNVNGTAASFTSAITAAGASIAGQQSFFQSSGQNCNLYIGNTLSTNQSGFLTYNSQYAPGGAGSVGIGVFGVSAGLTVAPSGSVGINQSAPSSAYALDVGGQVRVTGGLVVNGNVSPQAIVMSDRTILLRGDGNHRLTYDGTVDGPVLQGFSGGKLAAMGSFTGNVTALQWSSTSVTLPLPTTAPTLSTSSLSVTANVASNLAVSGLLQPYQQISMPANNLGDWMSGYYANVFGDRYGIGQYNNGQMRVFTSGVYNQAALHLSLASLDTSGGGGTFTDIVSAANSGVVIRRSTNLTLGNLGLNSGSLNLASTNTLCLGADQSKEPNAGKIGYNTFSGAGLDIIGAGTTSTTRKVNIFDQLQVNGTANAIQILGYGGPGSISSLGFIGYSGRPGPSGLLSAVDDGNYSTHLTLSTSPPGTFPGSTPGTAPGPVERVRVNTVGNVGINNPAPAYRLDVAGDINYTGSLYKSGLPSTQAFYVSWTPTIAAGASASLNVTFPNAFPATPVVTVTVSNSVRCGPSISGVSSTGVTVYLFNYTSTSAGPSGLHITATLPTNGVAVGL
ncbi:MAG: hypothetical protein EOO77_07890 [Oxalobacteraceae bacterium]|nr:MAG: hypothetical protein EOO77_07890 [Oxalobacteraceae bacterium]